LRWADSLRRSFGVDPLVDCTGQRMHWAGRLKPASSGLNQGGQDEINRPAVRDRHVVGTRPPASAMSRESL
jgi:hypothetical protein